VLAACTIARSAPSCVLFLSLSLSLSYVLSPLYLLASTRN
jgi:hypothetical protein